MYRNPYMHIPISYVDPHNHLLDLIGMSIPLSGRDIKYINTVHIHVIVEKNRCADDTNLSHLLKHRHGLKNKNREGHQ